jgi:hypothetical protein
MRFNPKFLLHGSPQVLGRFSEAQARGKRRPGFNPHRNSES